MKIITRKHPITGEKIKGHLHANGKGFVAETASAAETTCIESEAWVNKSRGQNFEK